MADQLIDSKRAAQLLDLTVQQIRNMCRNGRFPSKRIGKTWILKEGDIKSFAKNNNYCFAEDHESYYSSRELKSNKKLTALSFFSGAMGLDLGLEQAGFKILLACEIDDACRKTILKNRPKTALVGDLSTYTPGDIRKAAGLSENDDIDLMVGGPPCQAFSTAGKRKGFNDDRGNILLTYLSRIIALRPRYAVIENVRGILSAPLSHRPHDQRGPGYPPMSPAEQEGGCFDACLKCPQKSRVWDFI
jgi:DNA (cytosine-5)-methyltransferase 1